MIGEYADLKTGLTDSKNPFVWITSEGWSFHEQSGAMKFTSEQALAVNSFDELLEEKPEKVEFVKPVKTKK